MKWLGKLQDTHEVRSRRHRVQPGYVTMAQVCQHGFSGVKVSSHCWHTRPLLALKHYKQIGVWNTGELCGV